MDIALEQQTERSRDPDRAWATYRLATLDNSPDADQAWDWYVACYTAAQPQEEIPPWVLAVEELERRRQQ